MDIIFLHNSHKIDILQNNMSIVTNKRVKMSVDLRSDSKYYHGDCRCMKTELPSTIAIQCANCIDGIYPPTNGRTVGFCKCRDVVIKHLICKTCASIRDKIDGLTYELDEILYNVGYEIKQYTDCSEKVDRIKQISIELQHCNRRLLENLVHKQ